MRRSTAPLLTLTCSLSFLLNTSYTHTHTHSLAHILELQFFLSSSISKALANTCLIIISTVPFPTSKCLLLLLLLQLHCSLLLSAEATTPNIWQQHSGCAEELPSYSKLQPQSTSSKGTRWLAAEVSTDTGKEGGRATFESSKHAWMTLLQQGHEHIVHSAENLRVE